MKAVAVFAVVIAAAVGGYFMFLKPVQVPDMPLLGVNQEQVTLSDIRGDKDGLLLLFMMPKCPASQFSAGVVKDLYDQWGGGLQFTGLVFGNRETADRIQTEWELPFPVYGLRDAPDPYAVNEFIELVGSAHGARTAIYGGTVLVLDDTNKLALKLEQEEVRDLPTRIEEVGI